MKKMLLILCLTAFMLTCTGYAATKSIYVDKGQYSGDAYRYYEYKEGDRILTPCCWGWSKAGSGSWVKMTWETGVNLQKNWTFACDCKTANPYDVKTWAHVRRPNQWRKCDSTMKSTISCDITQKSINTCSWCINMQVYGKQYKNSGWGIDLMIRPNYSGSKSSWTKVWVDGQEWYKSKNEWNESGHFVRTVYAKKNKTYKHKIKVKPFMEHMGCKNWYAHSFELGWEVYTGAGSWKVNSIALNPSGP